MIAVVGGGMTGLALGLELGRLGADFVVLEASERPGGVIRSVDIDGRILDQGPQRTRLTASVKDVIARLGLAERVVTADPDLGLFVYRGGRLRRVPFSARDFLASDIVSLRAKMRLLVEPFTAPADPDERVADFFRRKVGRELYEALVGPLYGGLYASDPADMVVGLSLGRVLREFGVGRSLVLRMLRGGGKVQPPPAVSFKSGMAELPIAMANALGGRLRLDAPVHVIRQEGSGWRVENPSESFAARAVVFCTPAPSAGALLRSIAPRAAEALFSLHYNPLAVVHLEAEADLHGLGFQVAFTEDLMTRGVTFNDSLFGRRGIYTAYLGGARRREVEQMDEDDLARMAAREFASCTGYDARVLSVALEQMPAWDISWSALRRFTLPTGMRVAGNWWSRPGLPGRLAEAATLARSLTSGSVD